MSKIDKTKVVKKKSGGTVTLDQSIARTLREGTKLSFQAVFPSNTSGVLIIGIVEVRTMKTLDNFGGALIASGVIKSESKDPRVKDSEILMIFRKSSPTKMIYILKPR